MDGWMRKIGVRESGEVCARTWELCEITMTVKRAVGLAVKSMQKELQRFAFDASMYRDYGLGGGHYGERAAKHVEELKDAQGVLLGLVQAGDLEKDSFDEVEGETGM